MKIYDQRCFEYDRGDNMLVTEASELQPVTKWGRGSMFMDLPEGVGFAIRAGTEEEPKEPVRFVLEETSRDEDDTVAFWRLRPVNIVAKQKDLKLVVYNI